MKNDGTCFYVGRYDDPQDIYSPKCKSKQSAWWLADHYICNELCQEGTADDYAIRTAQRKNVCMPI